MHLVPLFLSINCLLLICIHSGHLACGVALAEENGTRMVDSNVEMITKDVAVVCFFTGNSGNLQVHPYPYSANVIPAGHIRVTSGYTRCSP